ncbi:uncharacterized protein TNCV_2251231 [Trichonephila clavipes]|nr:uncharacterized protein TNCV_2251231 [Trichonephila clavipes]
MEPVGAYRIFERSEDYRMLRYTDYYGDGNSKAFDTVKDIYGKVSVTKLECIGHIEKRVGTRLRKLKSRNKGLGGKGKLTDGLINKLENYSGIAIRSNIGNLDKMQSAVIAAFFHCFASKHGQFPVGAERWCKFQRAKASNIVYQDKSLGLPQNIVNTIKPVYMDLCDRNLLKKCLHGKTQNPNESFNAILWQTLPKEVFVEHQTLRLGSYTDVVQFNNDFQRLISILNEMGMFRAIILYVDKNTFGNKRIADSKRHSLPTAKTCRRKLRAIRKKKKYKN